MTLRDVDVGLYRSLVRWGAFASIVGYSAAIIDLLSRIPPLDLFFRGEIYTLGLAIFTLLLERQSREITASLLLVSTVSLEIFISFVISGHGMRTASLVQIPVVVVAAGLLLGARPSYLVAVVLPLLALMGAHLGALFRQGPGVGRTDVMHIIALTVSSLTTAILLHIFLRSFGKVLGSARFNERRMADLVRSSPDGVLVISRQNRVETHNDKAAILLGTPTEQLSGKLVDELPLEDKSDRRGTLRANDFSRLAASGTARQVEASKTGTVIELRVQRVAGVDNQEALLVLLRDITERIVAKAREVELTSRLLHSQKLEAVGRLAGGVAHDFNNLLTVVAGYADVIERFKTPRATLVADELRATYGRGETLTRQLLAFARRDTVSPRPIDLSAVISGSERLIQRLVGEQVQVICDNEEPCPIVADPGQIEQVLMNLATNASDAMPSGGTLTIAGSVKDESVFLEVSDTGSGIADSVKERIFEPFFTTKERGKGTGLGLSTVHGIVIQTGGEIAVESPETGGTVFRIRWPRSHETVTELKRKNAHRSEERGRGVIVLAEDDPQARRLLGQSLADAGFTVMSAQNGAEALSLTVGLEKRPDLIITDVMMPGMTGVELAERVRKQHPGIPVLFISGYTDDVLKPAHLDSIDDLLEKPFGLDELLERVFDKLQPSSE